MIFVICTILVILQQYKGMTTEVTDPCPSTIVESIVADMCKSSSATEETNSGSFKVDSVVLRIMTQQDNCICRVTIDNQIQPVSIGLSKYGDLASSAPGGYNCGLEVDINHIPDMSTGNVIDPIECVVNSPPRNIAQLQNNYLQFRSRIINGNFSRGYCMQIRRDSSSKNTQVLRINCDAPVTTEQTTRPTIQSDSTPHTSGRSTGETTITGTKGTNTDTSNVVSPLITTATEPTTSNTINTVNRDNTKSKGLEQTTYIAIGAGSGVALILLVVLVVICLRRKSTQQSGTNGNAKKSYQQEESDDKLPDNVLYVPAEEFDITGSRLSMEGNYSTLDEDIPQIANNTISMNGDYSTVELDEHLERNCRYPENSEQGQTRGKTPTIKSKP